MLFIATPCLDYVTLPYHMAIANLIGYLVVNKINHRYGTISDSNLARSRAELATTALKIGATHILFIDSDMVFSPEYVMRILSHNLSVVAATYPKRKLNWEKIKTAIEKGDSRYACQGEYTFVPSEKDVAMKDVMLVKYAPAGFLLVKTEVLEKLNNTYPELKYNSTHHKSPAYALFDNLIDEDGTYLSTDYSFCKRLNNCNIPIYVDFSLKVNHVGQHVFEGNPHVCIKNL